jgi:hypothetical protein
MKVLAAELEQWGFQLLWSLAAPDDALDPRQATWAVTLYHFIDKSA